MKSETVDDHCSQTVYNLDYNCKQGSPETITPTQHVGVVGPIREIETTLLSVHNNELIQTCFKNQKSKNVPIVRSINIQTSDYSSINLNQTKNLFSKPHQTLTESQMTQQNMNNYQTNVEIVSKTAILMGSTEITNEKIFQFYQLHGNVYHEVFKKLLQNTAKFVPGLCGFVIDEYFENMAKSIYQKYGEF